MSSPAFRSLGRSGLRVSEIGLGCNNFGRPGAATESQEGTTVVVEAALDAGITFFDTADIYGYEYGRSERMLGRALGSRRDEAVIATKFGHVDYDSPIPSWGAKGSRRYIRLAVEGSLKRLGTDRIDLYQLHTPDPLTPIEETLETLDELVREGKVLYLGHSNFAGWQIAEAELLAAHRGLASAVSAQDEYSLLVRGVEREVLPAVREFGLGFLPYFPLHNGLFTGKFSRTERPADTRISRQRPHILDDAPWDAIEAYAELCAERGVTMVEATFGWFLSRAEVLSVIAGATTPEQVRQNAASGWWRPDSVDLATIDRLFAPPAR